jgi:hypothetical protein
MSVPDALLAMLFADSEPVCGYSCDTAEGMAIELLCNGRLEHAGGYPADVSEDLFRGWIVAADLDPGKEYQAPVLRRWRTTRVMAWLRRAVRFLDDQPEDGLSYDLADALYETAQKGDEG